MHNLIAAVQDRTLRTDNRPEWLVVSVILGLLGSAPLLLAQGIFRFVPGPDVEKLSRSYTSGIWRDYEVPRRAHHALCAGTMAIIVRFSSRRMAIATLSVQVGFLLVSAVLKRWSPAYNDFYNGTISNLIRDHEKASTNVPNAFYFLGSVLVISILFSCKLGGFALWVTAMVDPACAIFARSGIHPGMRRVKGWDPRVICGGTFVGFVAIRIWFAITNIGKLETAHLSHSPSSTALVTSVFSLGLAFVVTVVESFSGKYDDNFTVPLATAAFVAAASVVTRPAWGVFGHIIHSRISQLL